MRADIHNPEFQLAAKFVNQTARPVFLTGKAGTGKTTFLRHIRENSFKKMAVVAPTGVAAINAGGTTLHSFFQLPFGPYIPIAQYGWNPEAPGFSDPNSLFKNIRFSANKRDLLQELELLVIDEISMVRADMLDAVDTILRHFRQQPLLPFGGLQMLYIGDLFQLPPVVSKEEWEILQSYYQSPFFFDAKVIRQEPPVYLELKKIYRQKEARFINILDNIRNARTTPDDLELLHDYYQPEFEAPKKDNYITLTSHNAKADAINQEELSRLRGKNHAFEATVTGEFSDKAYPAEKTLSLKEGAQIMLIKNDKGETRRYYNGKIGTIKNITGDKITILFPDEPDELTLEKETWKNIRYRYDNEKDQVEEEELGTFSQYPVRLAWAITIHKSQGLTFERAVIDAGASFAAGQVYVALSRLTNIAGMVLRSRISPYSIQTDPRVVAYTQSQSAPDAAEESLPQEQLSFIGDSLLKTFRWTRLTESIRTNYEGYAHSKIPDKAKAMEAGRNWLNKVMAQEDTAQKFTRQLEQLLPSAGADDYRQLHSRMEAAAAYFIKGLQEDLIDPLQEHISAMRIKQKAKKYTQTLQELKVICLRKKQQVEDALQMVGGMQKGVDTSLLLSELEENRRNRESPPAASSEAPASAASPATGRPPKGETSRISLQLYKEGVPIREIATRRSLTESTVEGHLASFIPTGEIDVTELVPAHKMERMASVIKKVGGNSLGPIKTQLGPDYSFGEIKAMLQHLRHAEQSDR